MDYHFTDWANLIFLDSWDHWNLGPGPLTTTDATRKWTQGNSAIAVAGRHGTGAQAGTYGAGYVITFPTDYMRMAAGIAYQTNAYANAIHTFASVLMPYNQVLALQHDGDGRLSLFCGGSLVAHITAATSDVYPIHLNVWYFVEMFCRIHDTNQLDWEVRINEQSLHTGTFTWTGGGPIYPIRSYAPGQPGGGSVCILDDLYITDGEQRMNDDGSASGSPFFDDCEVDVIYPDGDVILTGWTAVQDQVPIMTGDSTPSGVASASSYHGTQYAWKAFAAKVSSDSTGTWLSNLTTTGWLSYQFPTAQTITSYAIMPYGYDVWPDRVPTAWTLEGSNDGSGWTTLDTQTVTTDFWSRGHFKRFAVATPGSYTYYRVNISANGGDPQYVGIANLQLEVAVGSGYAMINEKTPDFDRTMLLSATVGDKARFTLQDIGPVGEIRGIQLLDLLSKSEAGTAIVMPRYVLGGVAYDGQAMYPSYQDWMYDRQCVTYSPATGKPFTTPEIDGLQIEKERTG
jgi:hypothetical protein